MLGATGVMEDIMKPFQTSAKLPPIIVIHGQPGIGKTTLALNFPRPIVIQTEDGCPIGVQLETFGLCESYPSVIEALTYLGKEDHDYRTLVIDSLDAFEPLVQAALCADRGYTSIESPGFGKGYVELDRYWLDPLRACNWLRRNRNMTIVMIAHRDGRARLEIEDGFDDFPFRRNVDRARCFVEHEQERPAQHGAGKAQPLALAAGNERATFAEHGVQSRC